MMISYQELVRTFPSLCLAGGRDKEMHYVGAACTQYGPGRRLADNREVIKFSAIGRGERQGVRHLRDLRPNTIPFPAWLVSKNKHK